MIPSCVFVDHFFDFDCLYLGIDRPTSGETRTRRARITVIRDLQDVRLPTDQIESSEFEGVRKRGHRQGQSAYSFSRGNVRLAPNQPIMMTSGVSAMIRKK